MKNLRRPEVSSKLAVHNALNNTIASLATGTNMQMIKSVLHYVTSRHLNVYFLAIDVQDSTFEEFDPCFSSTARSYKRMKSVRRHFSVMAEAQIMLEDVKYFFYFLLRTTNKEVTTCATCASSSFLLLPLYRCWLIAKTIVTIARHLFVAKLPEGHYLETTNARSPAALNAREARQIDSHCGYVRFGHSRVQSILSPLNA